MNLKPIKDLVLVRPEVSKDYEKTDGGIFMPGEMKKQQKGCQEAVVISAGPDVQSQEIKKGQRVLYDRYSGTEYKPDAKQTLLILREDDILAVIK